MTAIKLLAVAGILAAAPATAFAHDRDHDRDRNCHHEHGGRGPAVHVGVRPVWVPGYWRNHGPRRAWIQGAWATPPQAGWVWVAPQQVWDGYSRQWVWREGYWAPQPAAYGTVSYR
jgi:hypothetical protein